MLRKILFICILVLPASIGFAQMRTLTPQINFSTLLDQIDLYHTSGAYEYATKQVADRAINFIQSFIGNEKPAIVQKQKFALVLDIDDTSLSFFEVFSKNLPNQRKPWIFKKIPAIGPTLLLYHYALLSGIEVFFVTGRPEIARTMTIKQLVDAGYMIASSATENCEDKSGVSDTCNLFMRDKQHTQTSNILLKIEIRKKITDAGHSIIVNVGDQYSDLAGGYSLRTFKYPNYMYLRH